MQTSHAALFETYFCPFDVPIKLMLQTKVRCSNTQNLLIYLPCSSFLLPVATCFLNLERFEFHQGLCFQIISDFSEITSSDSITSHN